MDSIEKKNYRKYYHKNREKILKGQKICREKSKAKKKVYHKKYYLENNNYHKNYYKKNRERILSQVKENKKRREEALFTFRVEGQQNPNQLRKSLTE